MRPTCKYRDEWDDLVTRFIATHQPWDGYWRQSEDHALRHIDRAFKRTACNRLLDLGCGRGRLLPRFASMFREVVALDSDPVRIRQARELKNRKPTALRNVTLVEGVFENCVGDLGGPFDVILCSHVLQHMPKGSVHGMIECMHAALLPGGFLVVLTSHSTGQEDWYKLWTPDIPGPGVAEESIDGNEFDDLTSGECPDVGVPSHAFTIRSLRQLTAGLDIVKVHCFHALHKRNFIDHLPIFRDTWINLPGLRGLFGIDVLVIAKKVEAGPAS